MLSFIAGLFIGASLGVSVMCICSAASKADEDLKNAENENRKEE